MRLMWFTSFTFALFPSFPSNKIYLKFDMRQLKKTFCHLWAVPNHPFLLCLGLRRDLSGNLSFLTIRNIKTSRSENKNIKNLKSRSQRLKHQYFFLKGLGKSNECHALLSSRDAFWESVSDFVTCKHHRVHLHKPGWYCLRHTQALQYSLLLLGYKPVQRVTVLNTVGIHG